MHVEVDKEMFLESLGGEEAVHQLDPEAKADAIEDFLAGKLKGRAPTVAEVEEQIETRPFRMGAGFLFVSPQGNVKRLPKMPANPTILDFFNLRFQAHTTKNHCLQSAALAHEERHVGRDHPRLPVARHGARN